MPRTATPTLHCVAFVPNCVTSYSWRIIPCVKFTAMTSVSATAVAFLKRMAEEIDLPCQIIEVIVYILVLFYLDSMHWVQR